MEGGIEVGAALRSHLNHPEQNLENSIFSRLGTKIIFETSNESTQGRLR